jgi:hypothetical protein
MRVNTTFKQECEGGKKSPLEFFSPSLRHQRFIDLVQTRSTRVYSRERFEEPLEAVADEVFVGCNKEKISDGKEGESLRTNQEDLMRRQAEDRHPSRRGGLKGGGKVSIVRKGRVRGRLTEQDQGHRNTQIVRLSLLPLVILQYRNPDLLPFSKSLRRGFEDAVQGRRGRRGEERSVACFARFDREVCWGDRVGRGSGGGRGRGRGGKTRGEEADVGEGREAESTAKAREILVERIGVNRDVSSPALPLPAAPSPTLNCSIKIVAMTSSISSLDAFRISCSFFQKRAAVSPLDHASWSSPLPWTYVNPRARSRLPSSEVEERSFEAEQRMTG